MQAVALFRKSAVSIAVAAAVLAAGASPALAGDYASFKPTTAGPASERTGMASTLKLSVPLGGAARTHKPTVGVNLSEVRQGLERPPGSGVEAGFAFDGRGYVRAGSVDVTRQVGEKLGFATMQDGGGNRVWWVVGGVVLVAAIVLLADDDGGGY